MFNNLKRKCLYLLDNNTAFFSLLFVYTLFVFRRAATMHYFQDDFFFLQISRAKSIGDFFHFFSPFRSYSYKPLATEVFYFTLHLFKENVLIGHTIMFSVFFVGLFFLYRSILLVTKNEYVSKFSVLLYAISLSHVFQLYWFATFQEILMFSALTTSFYYFFKKRYFVSVLLFIAALLSKETAVFFSPFIFIINFIFEKKDMRFKKLSIFIVLSVVFYMIYSYSLKQVTSLDNYKIEPNIHLFISNSVWYLYWGIGFPNSLPGYVSNILLKPLPVFWELFKINEFKYYFTLLSAYILTFFLGTILTVIKTREYKKLIYSGILSLFLFYLFLGPILLFNHKWMVRITLPLIFISIFQAIWIYEMLKRKGLLRIIGTVLIVLYFIFNYYGILFNQSSGLFLLEDRIYSNASQYFNRHKAEILRHKYIYFKDQDKYKNDFFKTSQMAEQTFADQNFIDHFFPGSGIVAIYEFNNHKIPKDAYIINSIEVLRTD